MMDLVVHLKNIKLLDDVDVSTDQTSVGENINGYSLYAIQCIWDSASGTVSVITEASNDNINYSAIDTFIISGAADSRMLNVEKAGYSYVRVRTEGSATPLGNLTAILNAKIM